MVYHHEKVLNAANVTEARSTPFSPTTFSKNLKIRGTKTMVAPVADSRASLPVSMYFRFHSLGGTKPTRT